MLSYTADSAHGPVATASPELMLAVFALLDQSRRATERDLIEALLVPLDDHVDRARIDHTDATSCSCRALQSAAG